MHSYLGGGAYASGCVPWPSDGMSQTTVAAFLLRFPPALGKGPLTSWLPGLRVSVSFASSLFLASTLKKSGKWKVSDAHSLFLHGHGHSPHSNLYYLHEISVHQEIYFPDYNTL